MAEHNRKTLKHFYCKDNLWKDFESLARERGTTIDNLLNEAMERYTSPSIPSGAKKAPAPGVPVRPNAAPGYYGSPGNVQAEGPYNNAGAPAPPPPPGHAPAAKPRSKGYPAPVAQQAPAAAPPRPTARATQKPKAAASAPWPGPGAPLTPPLYIHYNGKRHLVNKEQFILGRGTQTADLTIRDGNISRQHCSVIYRGGQYFIRDLGSTNGIEFNGVRIESKRIEEGDIITLCEHQLVFSFRG